MAAEIKALFLSSSLCVLKNQVIHSDWQTIQCQLYVNTTFHIGRDYGDKQWNCMSAFFKGNAVSFCDQITYLLEKGKEITGKYK